jgi:PAS domain-containing protein
MSQKDIELILTRQLAGYLAMPIFIVDPKGTLLFFNEPAEHILGRRFEETGEMSADELAHLFSATDEDGQPLGPGEMPIVIALQQHRPAHRRFWIRGLDGVRRLIEVTALPLVAQAGRTCGAMAVFWEVS